MSRPVWDPRSEAFQGLGCIVMLILFIVWCLSAASFINTVILGG